MCEKYFKKDCKHYSECIETDPELDPFIEGCEGGDCYEKKIIGTLQ